ncbi:ADP-ribosylation/crystallin J1 [Roseibacterium beibuensis]|nr:ADP-ribosylation/crystallin J1 [Roseibacterium beibuensis]
MELAKISSSDWTAFPPRLPEQPIFYPVMNQAYAEQIARDWNSLHEPAKVGHVLAFDLPDDVTDRWPVQIAGGRVHEELWVPAEELGAFNKMIVGPIRRIATYRDGARVEEA